MTQKNVLKEPQGKPEKQCIQQIIGNVEKLFVSDFIPELTAVDVDKNLFALVGKGKYPAVYVFDQGGLVTALSLLHHLKELKLLEGRLILVPKSTKKPTLEFNFQYHKLNAIYEDVIEDFGFKVYLDDANKIIFECPTMGLMASVIVEEQISHVVLANTIGLTPRIALQANHLFILTDMDGSEPIFKVEAPENSQLLAASAENIFYLQEFAKEFRVTSIRMAVVQVSDVDGSTVIQEDPKALITKLLEQDPLPPAISFQELFLKCKDNNFLIQTALELCKKSNQYLTLLHHLERRVPHPHPSILRDALINWDTLRYLQVCEIDTSVYESEALVLSTPEFCSQLLRCGLIDAARIAFSRYRFPITVSQTTNLLHSLQTSDPRIISNWLSEFIQIVVEQDPDRTSEIVEWLVEVLHKLQVDLALSLVGTVLATFDVVPKNLAVYHPSLDMLFVLQKHLQTMKRLSENYKINFTLSEMASLDPNEIVLIMLHRCFTGDIKTLCNREVSQEAAIRGIHVDDILTRYVERSISNNTLGSERLLAVLDAFICPRRRAECVVKALRSNPTPSTALARVAEDAATAYPDLEFTIRTLLHLPHALPKLQSRWRRTAFRRVNGEKIDWFGVEGAIRLIKALRAPRPPRTLLAKYNALPPPHKASLLKTALVAFETAVNDRFANEIFMRNFMDFLRGTGSLDATSTRDIEQLYQLKIAHGVSISRNDLCSKHKEYERYLYIDLHLSDASWEASIGNYELSGPSSLIASKFNYIYIFSKETNTADELIDFYSKAMMSEDTIAISTQQPTEREIDTLRRLGRRSRELASTGNGAEGLDIEAAYAGEQAVRSVLSSKYVDRLALRCLSRVTKRPVPTPQRHALHYHDRLVEGPRATVLRELIASPASNIDDLTRLCRRVTLPLSEGIVLAIIAKLTSYKPSFYTYVDSIGQSRIRLVENESTLFEECLQLAGVLGKNDEYLMRCLKQLWDHGEVDIEGMRVCLSPYGYEAYLCMISIFRLWSREWGGVEIVRARLLLRLLQRYRRCVPPSVNERDEMPGPTQIAAHRLQATRFLHANTDIWAELKLEITLDNYEQWLLAIPLLKLDFKPRVSRDMIISSALKRSMIARQRALDAAGTKDSEWALHACDEPLIAAAHRAVMMMENIEWAAASLFYAVRGARPGPDRVAAAELCSKFTLKWVQAALGNDRENDAQEADRSIRARRVALSAVQTLYRMGRAKDHYLQSIEDPRRLLRDLYLDSQYCIDTLNYPHNELIDVLADATDINSASVRIEILENALDRCNGGPITLSVQEVARIRRMLSATPLSAGAVYLANAAREGSDVGRRLRATQCLLSLDDEALDVVKEKRSSLWSSLVELEARARLEACGIAWGGTGSRAVREACGSLAPRASAEELRALGGLAVRWRCSSGPLLAALERAMLLEVVCEIVAGRGPADAVWERALLLPFERLGDGGEAARARCIAALRLVAPGWGARADAQSIARVCGAAWTASAQRAPELAAPLLPWAGTDKAHAAAAKLPDGARGLAKKLRALNAQCPMASIVTQLLVQRTQ